MTDRELLRALLLDRSLRFGDFVLSSGQRSSYYIDARKTTMAAAGLGLVGRLGLAAIRAKEWNPTAVGGLTMGADPVACAIARASLEAPPTVDAFSVRKATKEHGTKKLVEGSFEQGARVVIVEDVITTGGSALEAIEAVRGGGGLVLGILAVIDRQEGGRERLAAAGFEVVAMTTIGELGVRTE